MEEQARTLPGLLVSTGGVRDWADPQLCCIRRRTLRNALGLKASDDGRGALTVLVPALCALEYPLRPIEERSGGSGLRGLALETTAGAGLAS